MQKKEAEKNAEIIKNLEQQIAERKNTLKMLKSHVEEGVEVKEDNKEYERISRFD